MATKGNVVSLNKSTEEHVQDETDQKTAWFAWAEEVLKPQFKKLEDATRAKSWKPYNSTSTISR
jgi:hypothetical protein